MRNKDEVKQIFDAIKKETDPMEAIKMLSDTSYETGMEACHERGEITRHVNALSSEIKEMKEIINGNGNPSASLISRMDRLEVDVSSIKKSTDKITSAIIGDIETDKPSLYQRMRDVEKVSNNATKLTWLLVGLFIAEIGARFFGLF